MLYKGGEKNKFCPKVWIPIPTFTCTWYEKAVPWPLTRVVATCYRFSAMDFNFYTWMKVKLRDFREFEGECMCPCTLSLILGLFLLDEWLDQVLINFSRKVTVYSCNQM